MIEPKIIEDERPDPALRESIARALRDYNTRKIGPMVVEPLAILLRHPESDAIIGGLWGQSLADWLFVDLLYVPDDIRTRGIGSALMKKAEEIAAKRGCVGVWLYTGSFQSPEFYEKLGYLTFGRLPDSPRGHERIYYCKRLDT